MRLDILASRAMGPRRVGVLLILASMFSAPSLAVSLTYIGPAFTDTSEGAGRVEATFAFSAPLTPGVTLTEADLSSWVLSAVGRTISSSTAFSFFDATFVLGADGLPSDWAFVAEQNLEGAADPESIASYFALLINLGYGFGSADGFAIDDVDFPNELAWDGDRASEVFGERGTWSIVNDVPEPGTLALLGLGLAGLGLSRRGKAH